MQRFLLGLLFSVFLSLSTCGGAAVAGEATDSLPPPQPITTADSDIPVDELELLLKPLTKGELLIEAEAWYWSIFDKMHLAISFSHSIIILKA